MLALEKFLQNPDITYPPLTLPFSDYIAQQKNLINRYREDLQQHREHIIDTNAPFALVPSNKPRIGVLLIHGLFDSAFITRDIGNYLQNAGMLVYSVLLPGHGTVPGALLPVDYHDWIKTVEFGIESLQQQVEKVAVVGFSTGGSLALLHALEHKNLAGICLLSPAIKIRSAFAFTANWHRAISWKWPRAEWLYVTEENDYAKYSSIPFNAVYQVYRLSKRILATSRKQKPNCPMLMVLSKHDKTVSTSKALSYFKTYASPLCRAIVYTNNPHETKDTRIQQKNSFYPDIAIKNFSHVSLPISADNFHYGVNGDFVDASRVEENKLQQQKYLYCALTKPERNLDDLLFDLNLIQYRRRRLTFNPDFAWMMEQIVGWMRRFLP